MCLMKDLIGSASCTSQRARFVTQYCAYVSFHLIEYFLYIFFYVYSLLLGFCTIRLLDILIQTTGFKSCVLSIEDEHCQCFFFLIL